MVHFSSKSCSQFLKVKKVLTLVKAGNEKTLSLSWAWQTYQPSAVCILLVNYQRAKVQVPPPPHVCDSQPRRGKVCSPSFLQMFITKSFAPTWWLTQLKCEHNTLNFGSKGTFVVLHKMSKQHSHLKQRCHKSGGMSTCLGKNGASLISVLNDALMS